MPFLTYQYRYVQVPVEPRVPKQCSYWARAPLDCQRQNNQPTPCRLLLNVWGPIQNVWGLIHFVCSSQYVHGARSTVLYCTVLYCAHLAIFMQYTGVFPTIQLEIPTFHSIYMRRSSWGFWRSNQPTNRSSGPI